MTIREDERFMLRALRLAGKGAGLTHPNPMVGSVIVKDGRILGEGWHRGPGRRHAEVLALEKAGPAAEGATLYVNLEPCAHHGRTPPCTKAITNARVARVVAACSDPHPLVNGRGFAELRRAGVDVTPGILEEKAEELNRAFFHFVRTGAPYVTLKMASTLDGRIADPSGRSRWVTGEKARRAVHRLRAQVDAVMVGVGTVLADDPRLDVREIRGGRNPLRIVLDPSLRTPLGAQLVEKAADGKTVFVVDGKSALRNLEPFREKGVRFIALPSESGLFGWKDLAAAMVDLGVLHILVEGGARTATWFLAQSAVRRMELFVAAKFLGSKGMPSVLDLGVGDLETAVLFHFRLCRRVGEDVRITADTL